MDVKLETVQKQTISQQMIQSMEILQMSAQELESYLRELSLENPVIEIEEPAAPERDVREEELARKLEWLSATDRQNTVYYQEDREEAEIRDLCWEEESLEDYLRSQILLMEMPRTQRAVMQFLILSLDEKGYLTETVSSVSEYLGVSEELVCACLRELQGLDPAGIGARSLSECLMLQLDRKGRRSSLAAKIVQEYLSQVARNHLPAIARACGSSLEEVQEACEEIRTLDPKPGSSFSSREHLRYIRPDAMVVKLEDRFEILVNETAYQAIRVSDFYRSLMETTEDAEAKSYLQEKIRQAETVERNIGQRTSTLLQVLRSMVSRQETFFREGPGYRRPMRLKDLAEDLGIHESTVSRALKGKYLQCTWGVYPLNYFLTSVAAEAGGGDEVVTPEQVQDKMRRLIEREDKTHPLSDSAIVSCLAEEGIEISRRTVNKYRLEMGIPDKSGRKVW